MRRFTWFIWLILTQVWHPVNGSDFACNKVPLSLEHWIDTVSHIGRKNNLNNLTAITDVIHQLQSADSFPVRAKLLHHPSLWMPLRYQWTTVHPNNPKLISHSITASAKHFAKKNTSLLAYIMIRSLTKKQVTFRFSTKFSWKDSSLMVSFILIFLCHHPTSKPRNCALRELNRQGQQTSLLLGFWHQILRKVGP